MILAKISCRIRFFINVQKERRNKIKKLRNVPGKKTSALENLIKDFLFLKTICRRRVKIREFITNNK